MIIRILVLLVLIIFSIVLILCYTNSSEYLEKLDHSVYGTAEVLPVVKGNKSSRVAVFMVATPEIESYSRYTISQNGEWCKLHGYDFYVYDESCVPELPINFSKIRYAIDLIKTKKYDYIMYIDADAIVHNMGYDVRNLAAKYLRGPKSLMFGEDCYSKSVCSKPGRINSGVFIAKSNMTAIRILNTWLDASLGRCNDLVSKFPNCQLIFSGCVYPRWFFFVSIIPFNLMNGFSDTLFIKHVMAKDDIERVSDIKSHYVMDEDRLPVF